MIDLHSHVLPGLDDGPATTAGAIDLLREVVADGVVAIAATPHVRDDFPTTPEQIAAGLAQLRAAASAERLDIEILPGAEVALDRVRFGVQDGSLASLALAGNPRYLLVECPYYGWPLDLADVLRALTYSGVRPVLAHPERNPEVQRDADRVVPLVDDGALVQVTASSLAGQGGTRARKTAVELLERGLVHLVGSDAHGAASHRARLSTVYGTVGDEALAEWLTTSVPEAIVADRELPVRPRARARRRSWPLSLRRS